MSSQQNSNLIFLINLKDNVCSKELSVYMVEKKNIAKNYNYWVGLGYRLDHKLLFGPPGILLYDIKQ